MLYVLSARLRKSPRESTGTRLLNNVSAVSALVTLFRLAVALRLPMQLTLEGRSLVLLSVSLTVWCTAIRLGCAARRLLVPSLKLMSLVRTRVLWVKVRLSLLSISTLLFLLTIRLLWLSLQGCGEARGVLPPRSAVQSVLNITVLAGYSLLVLLVSTSGKWLNPTDLQVQLTFRSLSA